MAKETPRTTAEDIKIFVETQTRRTVDLRKRIEDHDDLLRDDWFEMPGEYPENYQKMPTIKPIALKDKITSELAGGFLKRTIPYIGKESKVTKKDISITEQTSYGLTALANQRERSLGLPEIQAQKADDIARRGYVCERIWLWEKSEHGAKKLISDIAVWDILNLRVARGGDGLTRACYLRYLYEDELKDAYPKAKDYTVSEGNTANEGKVLIYDYWDKEWEIVVVGSQIVKMLHHNRGYLPIYVMPVGANRPRQSERHNDTYKFVGEDFAMSGGEILWPVLSRIMSYYLTTVALGTHPTQKLLFDGPNNEPKFASPQSLWEQGNFIPLDVSKKQDLLPMFQATLPREANELFNIATGEGELIAPEIAFGRAPATITAQGTAMLIHQAMAMLKKGKKASEQSDAWEAMELIRQFKDGNFGDIELQGVDGKQKQFDISPSRDSLITNRDIKSELVLALPQGQMEKIDMGARLKELGWISNQTGMDKFGDIADTESELERIAYEKIRDLMGMDGIDAMTEAIKDGNYTFARLLWAGIQQRIAQSQPQQGNLSAVGQMGQNPMTKPPMPANGMMPNTEQRLEKMGMVGAR